MFTLCWTRNLIEFWPSFWILISCESTWIHIISVQASQIFMDLYNSGSKLKLKNVENKYPFVT